MRRARGGGGVGERREYEVELSVNARSVFLAWVSAAEAARARPAPREGARPARAGREGEAEELASRMLLGLINEGEPEQRVGEARGYWVRVTVLEEMESGWRVAAAARAREAPGVFEEPDVWGCGPFELASLRSEARARLEGERLGAGLAAGGRGQEGAGAGIKGRL